jgi:hypothetical protein
MPGANADIQRGLEEAKKTELMSSITQASRQPGGQMPNIEQMGREAQQQVNQTGQKLKEQNIQQAATQQQQQLEEVKFQQLKGITEQQTKLDEEGRFNEAKLSSISQTVKQQLFDEATSFQRDQLNQSLFNEYQLHDWALIQSQSEEEYANYEQTMMQESEKQMQLYNAAMKVVQQQLQQEFAKEQQDQDQEVKRELVIAQQKLKAKIAAAQAEAANRAARWSTGGAIVGTLIGGAAGAIAGGPMGAAVGASAGGQLGTAAGSYVGSQSK